MNANLQKYLDESPKLRAAAEADMRRKAEAEAPFTIHPAKDIPVKPAFQPIEAYSAKDLRAKDIKAAPVVVDGLLPAGLSLLAGAPKRGKSWLALALAVAVATGGTFLDRRTRQGKALYLDLESGESRTQRRMSILLPGEWPEDLCISHRADMLGDKGFLLDQIRDWLDRNPDTRLVIIDTVGRVRGRGRPGEDAYNADTRTYGALQALALERGIAILGVHHYKKGVDDGDDWFEKISGSMGLTGVCDTVLALTGKRDDPDCILKSSSRDFEGIGDMVLRFDGGLWTVQGVDPVAHAEERAYIKSGVVRGLLALMRSLNPSEWQGTVSQLLGAMQDVADAPLGVYDAKQAGRELEQVERMLFDRDGIVIRRKIVRGARILSITQSQKDEF